MARIKRMLVATDLTGRSVYPLERALRLERETGAAIQVLHVVEPGLARKLEERRCADALAALQEWRAALPDSGRQDLALAVLVGDPFATILEQAEAQGVDLVVVGQPGKRGLKELFLGTTAERVVRFSETPVLMVNRHGGAAYQRVLAAMDFSQGARRALQLACRIAPAADVRIVHAWHSPLVGFSAKHSTEREAAKARLRAQEEQQIRAVLEQAVQPARPWRIDMIEAHPHAAIRNEIGAFNAELLAMGTHARSRLGDAVIGSLAQQLLAEGACDVLVTRA